MRKLESSRERPGQRPERKPPPRPERKDPPQPSPKPTPPPEPPPSKRIEEGGGLPGESDEDY
jgi:hypothetical protein